LRLRFIPACAGNAIPSARRRNPSPVHPRVCGERDFALLGRRNLNGSSPRVRGTPVCAQYWSDCERFIPACAGNAIPHGWAAKIQPVHPRVCGERAVNSAIAGLGHGSSPRVRGTRIRSCRRSFQPRFIPACAGNAMKSSPPTAGKPVHPRVCGERSRVNAILVAHNGSSPRVRGTLTFFNRFPM